MNPDITDYRKFFADGSKDGWMQVRACCHRIDIVECKRIVCTILGNRFFIGRWRID